MTPKIFIGTATPGVIECETADCLELMKYSSPFPCISLKTEGVYVFKQQNIFAQHTIKSDCTHLLLVENDMLFPANALQRLLAWDKDIVAADYPMKSKHGKSSMMAKDFNDNLIGMSEGLVKVKSVGTGLMLIKTDVLKKLPARKWFGHDWDENAKDWSGEQGDYQGNDYYFCNLCHEAGIDIWVDYDLSKELGHIGKRVFTWKDTI